MGNVAAVLIVLAGAFLLIVGLRGTQGAVFGGLFGGGTPSESPPTTTDTTGSTTTTSGTGSPGGIGASTRGTGGPGPTHM